jgi:hypothetical protein
VVQNRVVVGLACGCSASVLPKEPWHQSIATVACEVHSKVFERSYSLAVQIFLSVAAQPWIDERVKVLVQDRIDDVMGDPHSSAITKRL